MRLYTNLSKRICFLISARLAIKKFSSNPNVTNSTQKLKCFLTNESFKMPLSCCCDKNTVYSNKFSMHYTLKKKKMFHKVSIFLLLAKIILSVERNYKKPVTIFLLIYIIWFFLMLKRSILIRNIF